MFGAAVIVFRESLEAALIIGIMAAATRGIPMRSRWIGGGVLVGLAGAALVASGMEHLSGLASGMGQELFNAGVLALAVGMLAWHNIWMTVHGKEMVANVKNTAAAVQQGRQTGSVILTVVGLAVLREGAETVLFLYSAANSPESSLRDTLAGALAGSVALAVKPTIRLC